MAEKIEATVEDKIDKAVTDLLAISFRPGSPPKPEDAQKSAQAILNLAHAREIFSGKSTRTKGAGA